MSNASECRSDRWTVKNDGLAGRVHLGCLSSGGIEFKKQKYSFVTPCVPPVGAEAPLFVYFLKSFAVAR